MWWAGRGQNCQWSPRASRCSHPEFVATHLEHIAEEQGVVGTNTGSSGCAVSVADLAPLRSCTSELFIACGAACTGQKVVCAKCCTSRKISVKPQQGHQHNALGVGWDGTSERSEDQFARVLGELGRLSTWFTRGILMSPECWWTTWKVAQDTPYLSAAVGRTEGSWAT